MTLATIALVTAAFLLLNALYVAAEFALVAAPRTAIEHRAGEGDRLSGRLVALLDSSHEQDRYIATAQLGITIASLGLGMFGEQIVMEEGQLDRVRDLLDLPVETTDVGVTDVGHLFEKQVLHLGSRQLLEQ